MAKKVVKLSLKRKPDYLYYVDRQGDVSMAKMVRKKESSLVKVAKYGIEKKSDLFCHI